MKIIAAVAGTTPEGAPAFAPAEPFPPPSAIVAVRFDGEKYVVYEPGDEIPEV